MVCEKVSTKSILDYGCGKQYLKQSLPDYQVTSYDPCIEGLDSPPTPHDVVYCGDVLEHVEPDFIDSVLTDIHRVTGKLALLITNSEPAGKILSDGRNAHLIQQPMWWWCDKISNKFRIATYEYRRGDHIFLVHKKTDRMKRWDWVHLLAKQNNWKRGAELGVREGRLSIYLAQQGISMVAVDLWAPRPEMANVFGGETYEKWPHDTYFQNFSELSKGLPIHILREDTRTAHTNIPDQFLDFVFVDGDHSYEGVKADIQNWKGKIFPGGMMCGHDYDLPTVNRAIKECFPGSKIIQGLDKCWGVTV